MKKFISFQLVLSCFLSIMQAQDTIHVPDDYQAIQQGIDAAVNGNIVLVDTGYYLENINFNGKKITLSSHYLLDGDTSHISNTVIDGSQPADPDSGSVVTFINGEDTTSVLYGFTITGGTGTLIENGESRTGGGVICYHAGAKILHNRIIDNHVAHTKRAGGAGISCISKSGDYSAIIRHNMISNNSAASIGIGAITAFGAGIYSSVNVSIKDNIITYNKCENAVTIADGGGVEIELLEDMVIDAEIENNVINYNVLKGYRIMGAGILIGGSGAKIKGNEISYNSGEAVSFGDGGGIYVNSPSDSIQIIDNTISENVIQSDYYARGGGVMFHTPISVMILRKNKINHNKVYGTQCRGAGVIFRYPEAKVSVMNNEFIGNSGSTDAISYNGGGICLNDAYNRQVVIDGNIFQNDTAIDGGGIYSRRSYNLQLTNNLFVQNDSENGGGIELYHYSSSFRTDLHPQINNNTFYGNTSTFGGAIMLRCELNVPVTFNNIFFENQSLNGDDFYLMDNTDTILIAYTDIDPANIEGNSPWTGLGNINEDPVFIDPVNGYFCIDSCGSPCVAAGTDSVMYDDAWYHAPDHDIRDSLRPNPADTPPDMGAYEVFCMTGNNEIIGQYPSFSLQIYPNPNQGIFNCQLSLVKGQLVSVRIVDLQGREVTTLSDRWLPPGERLMHFDLSALPDGIYFIRIEAGDQVSTGKVVKM